MTVENLPPWTILPNWRQPITERLDWLTSVMPSQTGSEQTIGLRLSPRRSFEFTVSLYGASKTLFDLSVGKVGYDPWYLPVWHDAEEIVSAATAGATSIATDTAGRGFVAGGFAILLPAKFGDEQAGGAEIAEVASVAADSISLVGPLSETWPAGALLAPAVKARFTELPNKTRISGRIAEAQVRLEVVGPSDLVEAAPPLTTYDGLPVLSVPPDESKQLTAQYERLADQQDNDTGVAERLHTSDFAFVARSHAWFALGRSEHAELRALFYALAGRNNHLWVPSFEEDLFLAAPVALGDSSITVRACGFTYFGGPRGGREDLQIVLKDGTVLCRHITGVSLTVDGNEAIVLSSSLPAMSAESVERISFLTRGRLDTDSIELTHITDTRGVTQAAAVFRSVPDTRLAMDYEVAGFGNTAKSDSPCGECIPGLVVEGPYMTLEPPTQNLINSAYMTAPGSAKVSSLPGGAFAAGYVYGEASTNKLAAHVKVFDAANDEILRAMISDSDRSYADKSDVLTLSDGRFVTLTRDVYPVVFSGAADVKIRTFNALLALEHGPTQKYGGETSTGLSGDVLGYAPGDNGDFYVVYFHGTVGSAADLRAARLDGETYAALTGPSVVFAAGSLGIVSTGFNSLRRVGNRLVFVYREQFTTGKEFRWSAVVLDLALSVVAGPFEVSDVTPSGSDDYDEMLGFDATTDGRVVFSWWSLPGGTLNSVGSAVLSRALDVAAGAFEGPSSVVFTPAVVDDPYYNPKDVDFAPSSAAASTSGTYLVVTGSRGELSPDYYVSQFSEARVFYFNGATWSQGQVFDINPEDLVLDPSLYFFRRTPVVSRLDGGDFVIVYTHLESYGPPALEHGRLRRYHLTQC